MDADDLQSSLLVLGVPGPQLRDRVATIDSAVGPELDKHDTTAQVVHC